MTTARLHPVDSTTEGSGPGENCGEKDVAGWDLPGDWVGLCDMGGLSMPDLGLHWFRDIARFLRGDFLEALVEAYREIGVSAIRTPTPGSGATLTLGRPDGGLWAAIYDSSSAAGGGWVFVLALLVLVAAVATRHIALVLDVGGAYTAQVTRRKLWTGLVVVVCWYWIGAVTLWFAHALTLTFMPDPAAFSETMIEFVAFDSLDDVVVLNPILTFNLAGLGVVGFLALKALFLFRNLFLVVYILVGPVIAALAFSGIPVVEAYSRSALTQFVPLAFLSVPAAVVFRAANLLADNVDSFLVDNTLAKLLVFTLLPVVVVLVSVLSFRKASQGGATVANASLKSGGRAGLVAGALALGSASTAVAAGHSGTRGVARSTERKLIYGRHLGQSAASDTGTGNSGAGPATGRRSDDPVRSGGTAPPHGDGEVEKRADGGRSSFDPATGDDPATGAGSEAENRTGISRDGTRRQGVEGPKSTFRERLADRVVQGRDGSGTRSTSETSTGNESGSSIDWQSVPDDPSRSSGEPQDERSSGGEE